MKKLREKKWEISVMALCLVVFCFFIFRKDGFHMDEMLSFELANAEFNPWIVTTQPEGRLAKFVHNEIDGETLGETLSNLVSEVKDVLVNRGNSKLLTYKADVYEEPVWITAEQFRDYIEVGRGDAFNYLSVYFNVKDDNHPPLHFMLLHTVSSVFRGRAEAWMGCLVNLAAAVGILALLIRTGRLLAEVMELQKYRRLAGVLAALLYGISAGAVATVLLIRMYGTMTLWCVAYFYLILNKWRNKEFDRHNKALILVTMLGFWTQYFFLFYCILLAGTVCVLLLRSQRKKELGCFVRSMMIAAALGLAIFPFAISDVFASGRGVEAMGNLASGLQGYGSRLIAFLQIVAGRTFTLPFWIILLIGAAGMIFLRVRKNGVKPEGENNRPEGCGAYIWMLVFPIAGYFLLAARMSPYLVDRYVMPVFPFVILAVTLLLLEILKTAERYGKSFGERTVTAVCLTTVLLQLWGLTQYDGSYLYTGYWLQETIARENADYPCICIYEGVGYYENLKEFTYYERSLLLTLEELENRKDKESIAELDKVAVLMKCEETDTLRVLDIMKETYGFTVEQWGWRDSGAHGNETLCFMSK